LTSEGDLIISDGSSRSQEHNKKMALDRLADTIRKALHVPKKRMATKIPKAIKEARLEYKARQSNIKKMRSKKITDY
jgi:ribosome-associated protein